MVCYRHKLIRPDHKETTMMDEYNNFDLPEQEDQWRSDSYTYYSQPRPEPQPVPQPKPKKKKTGLRLTALALCFSLLGGVVGAGGVLAAQRFLNPSADKNESDASVMLEGIRESSVIEKVEVDTGERMTAAEVYAANVNSTVGITTSITTNFWGYQSTSAASGSGFIISADGYILTNFHVIENSDSISVALFNGESYAAELIGYDESNDIAVLKIEAEDLAPVILGDSDNLNVGDSVVAIGNPLGELTFSLTAGTVSAKDREVTFSNHVTMDLLQTDCAINSGNSGGALFNMYGEVIGVTNAKYSGSSGSGSTIDNIGFAIPLNSIRSIVESIIEKGYVSKPYIGVSVSDVNEAYLIYGLPRGAAVQTVTENGPAAEAGLQIGDIVTAVNGKEITGGNELIDIVSQSNVGDELKLTVYRKGNTTDITVTVGEQIQSAQKEPENSSNNAIPFPWGYGGFGN